MSMRGFIPRSIFLFHIKYILFRSVMFALMSLLKSLCAVFLLSYSYSKRLTYPSGILGLAREALLLTLEFLAEAGCDLPVARNGSIIYHFI